MNNLGKAFIMSVAVAATTLAPMATASADHRGYRNHHSEWRGHGGRDYYRHRRSNNNDAVALGVIGLAAGAIIGGAIADSRANQRVYIDPPQEPVYYPPAPRYVQPRYAQPVQRYEPVVVRGSLQPWSPAWYDYCESRYRSFDASSGTYRGYDGGDHFCVAN